MLPKNLNTVLITGNSSTSVLFKSAIYWAEQGEPVWFISASRITELPADFTKPPDKEILKLIIFIYVPDMKNLIAKLNEIHIWSKIPRAIITTHIDDYWDPKDGAFELSTCAYLTASLIDAASIYGVKKDLPVYLIVSLGKNAFEKFQTLVELYFSNVFDFQEYSQSNFEEIIKVFKICINK